MLSRLGLDRQDAVLERHLDLLLFEAGHRGYEGVRVIALEDVDWQVVGRRVLQVGAFGRLLAEELLDQTVHGPGSAPHIRARAPPRNAQVTTHLLVKFASRQTLITRTPA